MPDQQRLKFGSRNLRVERKGDRRELPPFRFWMIAALMVMTVVASVFLLFRIERYLIRNEHFLLAGPPDPGEELPGFEIRGLRHTSRERVLEVFDRDFGRSLYLMPLRERRAALLRIDWVRDASIYRVWPNQLQIEVSEREPVAFARLPALSAEGGSEASSSSFIDAEGVLLSPPGQGEYHLPVLTGIGARDSLLMRRERVRQMLRLLSDAGDVGQRLSEIDVGDLHNLKVTLPVGNRVVTLLLGDRNFRIRLMNFFNHYADVEKRMPGATTLDLRLEDRITVVDGLDARR